MKTRIETNKAFVAADDAWAAKLASLRIDRYTVDARGEPHSELRALWLARHWAMTEWEKACGIFHPSHSAPALEVQQ